MNFETQVMKEINVPVELYINKLQSGDLEPVAIINYHIPYMCEQWIRTEAERNFLLSYKEKQSMPERIDRSVSFEILIDINNDGKAYRAECQTICPAFVAAWIELEAMKQYNQQKVKV